MDEQNITQQSTDELAAQNKESRAQQRIKELSDKVELTSKERDELKEIRTQDQQKIAELERENTFNSKFADVLGTHSSAKDHKDEIKAKVMAGYDVEDATLAVLGKLGKLGNQSTGTVMPAGGSAANTISQDTSNKSPNEMTQAERRDKLEKELLWQ